VYAVTAHLLYLNGIIGESDVLDAKTLPLIKTPNRDGFVPDPRPDVGKASTPQEREADARSSWPGGNFPGVNGWLSSGQTARTKTTRKYLLGSYRRWGLKVFVRRPLASQSIPYACLGPRPTPSSHSGGLSRSG